MNQLLNRFEKKIHDMMLSRMISIQTSPQIRLIQLIVLHIGLAVFIRVIAID